jgi:hypothetical protein
MTRVGKNDDNEKKSSSRSKRLATALRENLRRRKAQERGRGLPAADTAKDGGPVPRNDRKS